ncbi:MAG: AAA family ATPase [Planctomycetaceae bacterium]|nr:AAA family ATPase [Planctomycetaceae bacterium]|tara:strand:- start:1053 stop:3071 length:2019 start_codon:yes stop_codon:yes gene_type:complete
MAHGLNPAQLSAVRATQGPVLVLAGAGSGKTRVITFRIAYLIQQGVSPDKILAVTFTNKAAREMQQRTEELLKRTTRPSSKTGKGKKPPQPHVSTFHSLCVGILRQDIESLGYRKRFTIYDRSDQEGAARKALRDIHCPTTALRPSDLLWRIGDWKREGLRAEAAGDTAYDEKDTLAALAYTKYELALKAANAVDFDDLLLCTEELFREHPDVLARHQERFDYVMVDEYQDTNATQYRIISSLVAQHGNLCVVGDDDQSIYGWRGARMENILEFDREFPDATIVRLEENYRCRPQILDLANRLILNNTERREKTLKAARAPGVPPRFLEIDDEVDEATYIAREIRAAVDSDRFRYKDVAILFRTNEQPRLFEQELRANKVPYVLIGGQSFFDRREVRDMISYLKVIANPDDELSLLRIINRPARGIGDGTVSKLLGRAVEAGKSLWHVLPQATVAGDIPQKGAENIERFRTMIEQYRKPMAQGRLSEQLTRLLTEINYKNEIERQYKTPLERVSRWSSVEELVNATSQYERGADQPTLDGFLEEIALTNNEDETDKDEQLKKNAVALITLHSAKGLEFPVVFLVGMEEGLLPHERSIQDGHRAICEERRLAYVGVTRAKDFLTLSWAKHRTKWGKRRKTKTSRFLTEMNGGPVGFDEETETPPSKRRAARSK